jgi:FkbM family methyltransferase
MLLIPGLNSILRATVRHMLPFGTKVWARIQAGEGEGLWLKIDPRWHNAYLEGSYEPGIQKLLREHLRPGDVFYDVGAHIGFFSMIAARLVGEKGKVFAFEAAPENVAALEQNVRRNGLPQIEINPVAVWSKSSLVKFKRPYAGALAGAVIELDARASEAAPELQIEVQATTLDSFAEKHPIPRVVKIDVEGAEAEVLEGAKELFQQCRPLLICEVHHPRAEGSVCPRLKQQGYVFDWMTGEQAFPRHLIAEFQSIAPALSSNSQHRLRVSALTQP